MNRYYSKQRPVSFGTYPLGMVLDTHNYDSRRYIDDAGCEVWGYIDYDRELSKEECDHYALVRGGLKTFWVVATSVNNHGNVVSNIVGTERHVSKPETICKVTSRKDIYLDYFESEEAAQRFVRDAREA